MEKKEREWVAMMLAELNSIGMKNIADHYKFVLFHMDPLLEKEYSACIRTFRLVERSEKKNDQR